MDDEIAFSPLEVEVEDAPLATGERRRVLEAMSRGVDERRAKEAVHRLSRLHGKNFKPSPGQYLGQLALLGDVADVADRLHAAETEFGGPDALKATLATLLSAPASEQLRDVPASAWTALGGACGVHDAGKLAERASSPGVARLFTENDAGPWTPVEARALLLGVPVEIIQNHRAALNVLQELIGTWLLESGGMGRTLANSRSPSVDVIAEVSFQVTAQMQRRLIRGLGVEPAEVEAWVRGKTGVTYRKVRAGLGDVDDLPKPVPTVVPGPFAAGDPHFAEQADHTTPDVIPRVISVDPSTMEGAAEPASRQPDPASVSGLWAEVLLHVDEAVRGGDPHGLLPLTELGATADWKVAAGDAVRLWVRHRGWLRERMRAAEGPAATVRTAAELREALRMADPGKFGAPTAATQVKRTLAGPTLLLQAALVAVAGDPERTEGSADHGNVRLWLQMVNLAAVESLIPLVAPTRGDRREAVVARLTDAAAQSATSPHACSDLVRGVAGRLVQEAASLTLKGDVRLIVGAAIEPLARWWQQAGAT